MKVVKALNENYEIDVKKKDFFHCATAISVVHHRIVISTRMRFFFIYHYHSVRRTSIDDYEKAVFLSCESFPVATMMRLKASERKLRILETKHWVHPKVLTKSRIWTSWSGRWASLGLVLRHIVPSGAMP